MLKKYAVLAGVLLAGQAWCFPFDVEERMEGVTVAVSTMNLGDNMGAVTLENYGNTTAQCSVRFRGGPGVPVNRKARIEPGQVANVTAGFNQQVIRMRVDVRCQPAKGKR